MESEKNVEMIQKAIKQLLEEEEIKLKTSDERFVVVDEAEDSEKAGGSRRHHHHRRQLLSELMSQIESLEQDNNITEASNQEANIEETLSSDENITKTQIKVDSNEEIIKELKNIQRQNTITHYLVTAMIVLTIAWQLSEVSLILKIKNGLTNPFKSFGGLVKGFLKNRPEVNVQDAIKQATERHDQVIEPTYLPGIKIPELSHLGFPDFDNSDDED